MFSLWSRAKEPVSTSRAGADAANFTWDPPDAGTRRLLPLGGDGRNQQQMDMISVAEILHVRRKDTHLKVDSLTSDPPLSDVAGVKEKGANGVGNPLEHSTRIRKPSDISKGRGWKWESSSHSCCAYGCG